MSTIVLGDDTDAPITIKNAAGAVVDVSGADAVQAVLLTLDRTRQLTPIYNVDLAHPSGTPATGVVIASVVGADTSELPPVQATWEVQVQQAGRKTTYLGTETVSLVKGWIP
jgi:hypothetical protein